MRLQNSSNNKKPYFPMFIDLSEKKIVVIGGGKIAERRVKTLLSFTDHVIVIAPEITDEICRIVKEGNLVWIKASFCEVEEEVLSHADMVLAATNDPECNEEIAVVCKKKEIPVNVSHKKELCDFYFPAVVVKENVVAGITASGLDHSQARKVRERVEEALSK